MVKKMTKQQFDAYLTETGNRICKEDERVSFVSNNNEDIVAMYWREEEGYLETLEESIKDSDITTASIEAAKWREIEQSVLSFLVCVVILAILWFMMQF